MNFMKHETQLDLRLAGSKEFGLLLKLILYTSFEVITGFLCPFNRRIRLKTQCHAIVSLVEKTFQTANEQGRAERKLLHVKMSSGETYAVRCRCMRPRAIPLALTKISRIDRLPFFLTHGALCARAAISGPAVAAFDLVYCSLSIVRFVSVFNVGQ